MASRSVSLPYHEQMAEYLIQYGVSAFVGRFRNPTEGFERRTGVVIQSPRGTELGTILEEIHPALCNSLTYSVEGELLRVMSEDDITQAKLDRKQANQILATLDVGTAPIAVLDAEMLHGGRGLILHVLPWESCQLDAWLAALGDDVKMPVRVLNVGQLALTVDPPEPTSKCGSGGCGTGGGCGTTGGGCSTGSCSKGSVKSASELTEYFAGLRKQMEQSQRIPLLG
jgi:hypothetical protein